MRWTLLDGSPRGKRSNTAILLERLARGLTASGHTTELHHLALPAVRRSAAALFEGAERFVLGFPLYTDAMPGQVMEFFEGLEPLQARAANAPLAFLVQSGFPEPGQSRAIERYLEQLALRLHSPYLGTLVRGGVEGIQAMPAWMTRTMLDRIEAIGRGLGATGALDPRALRELAGAEWLNGWRLPVLHLALSLGSNPYWNRLLKQNGAFARRLDRPFGAAKNEVSGSRARELPEG